MRKLILILFILLSCVSLANSGGIISFPGGGVPSAYDWEETLESAGYDTPACGTEPCYRNAAGTPNPDLSTAGIDMVGSLCLSLDHTLQLSEAEYHRAGIPQWRRSCHPLH